VLKVTTGFSKASFQTQAALELALNSTPFADAGYQLEKLNVPIAIGKLWNTQWSIRFSDPWCEPMFRIQHAQYEMQYCDD
jgi:hypothetical protein